MKHLEPEQFSTEVIRRFGILGKLQRKIGNTPLIEVVTPPGYGKIFGKCESYNFGGTVKARVAFAMLWRLLSQTPAEKVKDLTILEYSGGTLAKCLAKYCQELKIRLVLVLSEATAPSIINDLRTLNAEVHLTPRDQGFYGVIEQAKQMAKENPEWSFLYQHTNEANQFIHYSTTGEEIINQLKSDRVDAWVASIGTGGTLTGVYQKLKQAFPAVKAYATTPAEMPYGTTCAPNSKNKFAGSGGLGFGAKQPFVAPLEAEIAGHLTFDYAATLDTMKQFYLDTGTKIGSSSAANLMAALQLAEQLGPQSVIVTVFPCSGFSEEWQNLLSA
ncbi:cysteine synthase A [Idiomarina loihiensis]|uniref:PLP-dependent cysteine synthase family protein n=1 Tax=Idiomarina TaxID=135575 RepID=UPI000D92664B|nr:MULTISPECIES: pyridoxal-phosphate dependent enzyme [Idiomarina]PWW40315.1 cysteine synthase A [Idiomarina loihiensis]TDP50006.1 cysteine synthase A [Idiomarina loihiensis]TDS24642.1 cysteine synthase A [Idiomarina sp. H2]